MGNRALRLAALLSLSLLATGFGAEFDDFIGACAFPSVHGSFAGVLGEVVLPCAASMVVYGERRPAHAAAHCSKAGGACQLFPLQCQSVGVRFR